MAYVAISLNLFWWKDIFNLKEIQTSDNASEAIVICAQRINLNYSGHIYAVATEKDNHKDQAGNKNFRYAI